MLERLQSLRRYNAALKDWLEFVNVGWGGRSEASYRAWAKERDDRAVRMEWLKAESIRICSPGWQP